MLVLSLPKKSRKRLARDVRSTDATLAVDMPVVSVISVNEGRLGSFSSLSSQTFHEKSKDLSEMAS